VQNIAEGSVAANTLICLINQASYLLGRQLENLDQTFLEQGGFTERLHAARTRSRTLPSSSLSEKSDSSDRSDPSDASSRPACPHCGRSMVQRIARKGPRAGLPFWSCSAYPDCTGTRPADSSARPAPR
jgi:four helix bundle suffix protein